MNIQFPDPSATGVNPAYMTRVLSALRSAFLSVVSKDESVPRILLSSPSGKVYSITVSDTGTVTATLNDGKSRI
jgi:hypothetical protein